MLAALAAVLIPSAIGALVLQGGFGFLCLFGAMSMAVFLPLVAWQLPRTRRPLLACLVLGAVAAPGPVGFALMIMGLVMGGWQMIPFVYLFAAPYGIAGGFIFWLCLVWRNADLDAAGS